MATLVLTTIGTAIGGPLGGALGALIGQSVDQRLFAPGGRTGPRLSDLRVQTSVYGTAIPQIFGTMRVAGTVIWATDLIERRNRTSNGKGRGSTTTFSYTASFAVALSSRPISAIGRIWAEGNLLRGSDGRLTSSTGLRVHDGSEDQEADPLIAAAEGVNACPAFRGIAYVVFEDMDLAPFGNRIPSLSFEVVADDGPLAVGTLLADALQSADIVDAGPQLSGYAQTAGTRRAAVQALVPLCPVRRRPGAGWVVGAGRAGDPPPVSVGPAVISQQGARTRTLFASAVQRPARISVRHYDPSRDFQTSLQTARLPGATGADEPFDLPMASDASSAKRIAAALARRAMMAAHRVDRFCGLAALAGPVGSLVLLPDGRSMQVAERRIEDGQIALLLDQPDQPGASDDAAGDGGRGVLAPDLPVGDSFGFVFDLPRWDALSVPANGSGPGLFPVGPVVIAAGTGPGWRSASVDILPAVGAEATTLGRIAGSAIVGRVDAVVAATQSSQIDEDGWIDVTLLRPDMYLANAGPFDLLAGRNMAMAGAELLQFGHAEPLGDSLWRLTRLLRGRIGTENAMASLAPGAPFALIEGAAPLPVPASIGLLPVTPMAEILLADLGTGERLSLALPSTDRSRVPLSPVHLRHAWRDDGGLDVRWIRRSWAGHAWRDGSDVPLDEAVERYRVTVAAGVLAIDVECLSPWLSFSAAQIAAWREAASLAVITVRQLGAWGASAGATDTAML